MAISDLVSDLNSTRVYKPLQTKKFLKIYSGAPRANVIEMWCHMSAQGFSFDHSDSWCAREYHRALGVLKGSARQCDGYWLRLSFFSKGRSAVVAIPLSDGYAFTITETAGLLKVSRSTIYRLVKDGDLEVTYIRASPRFFPDEIERFLRKSIGAQRAREVANPWL